MSRFLRENSQFIASILITGYAGITVMFRINKGDIIRNQFEFKTKSGSYLGLSFKDEEEAKKFLFRLSDNDYNFEFFRCNTLDFVSFGFSKFRQGSHIGLPPSYFANSKSDFPKLIPSSGFYNFIGQNVSIEDLNKKMSPENKQEFYDTLVLTSDAKLFGLAREVANTENFILSTLDRLVELFCLSAAYVYSYAKTRAHKMQYFQRRKVFVLSGLCAFTVIFASKLLIPKLMQKTLDFQACQMGLDCCIGSIEFYEKNLLRNRLLRDVIQNGHNLIDSSGNILKQPVYLPFTDYYFYINYLGIKLTDRKEFCKKQLNQMVNNLNEKMEEDEKKAQELQEQTDFDSTKSEKSEKEFKIFQNLRLKLENIGKNN